MRPFLILLALFCTTCSTLSGQSSFLEPADSLHRGRFWACVGIGSAMYGSASYGLYHAWYKNYELAGFRTFDDSREWLGMDKAGHAMTAYNYSELAFQGLRWTGMPHNRSVWMAAGVSTLLQTTVEVMDGHSVKWGFSWYDVAFNTLGTGLFVGQQLGWREQRILLKVSNSRPAYPEWMVAPTGEGPGMTLRQRAYELYGRSYGEAFLKDYNGQIIWASANISSFLGESRPRWLPGWLNIAAGYSAENMFGGYGNTWSSQGYTYTLDEGLFPRHRQYYLSFDIDLRRIPSDKRWVRLMLGLLNFLKVPAPALSLSGPGGLQFHPVLW